MYLLNPIHSYINFIYQFDNYCFSAMTLDIFPLTDAWIPSKLYFRDEQLNHLLNEVKRGFSNFWIYGGRGVGKTLTVELLEKKVNSLNYGRAIYVSCQHSSAKKTMLNLSVALGIYTKTNHELRICDALESLIEEYGKVVLIFDDLDVIGKFARQYFSPYLHSLYDAVVKKHQGKVSLILVSTVPYEHRFKYIEDAVDSRYAFQPLFFRPYTKNEMKILLIQRLTCIDGLDWSEDAVDFICEKVSRQIGGDFRKVLDLARKTIQLKGRLRLEDAKEIWFNEKINFWVDKIKSMQYHEALILACITAETMEIMKKDSSLSDEPPLIPVSWSKVKNRYVNTCRSIGVDPLSPKMQYYILEKLWRNQWIEKLILPANHEWNYTSRKGLFIRLNEKLENIASALQKINLYEPW